MASPLPIVDTANFAPQEAPILLEKIKAKNIQPKAKLVQEMVKSSSTVGITAPANSSYSGSLQQWLKTLRDCESGGNYQINTGNGYYGAYQFSKPTWDHWQTGYAYAHLAPPAVQDAMIIKNTNAVSDGLASQNPGCYIKHGLSQFPPK